MIKKHQAFEADEDENSNIAFNWCDELSSLTEILINMLNFSFVFIEVLRARSYQVAK